MRFVLAALLCVAVCSSAQTLYLGLETVSVVGDNTGTSDEYSGIGTFFNLVESGNPLPTLIVSGDGAAAYKDHYEIHAAGTLSAPDNYPSSAKQTKVTLGGVVIGDTGAIAWELGGFSFAWHLDMDLTVQQPWNGTSIVFRASGDWVYSDSSGEGGGAVPIDFVPATVVFHSDAPLELGIIGAYPNGQTVTQNHLIVDKFVSV